MLREFIATAYKLAISGRFALLRDYFRLIEEILAAPPPPLPRLRIIAGEPVPKE